jgi:hypothetical protein
MQQSPLAGEAMQRAPSWYLARGDKRYGPIGDRELLLLAERGGLKTDDLLWRQGFSSWKPVRDVCDLGATPAIAARQDPPTEEAGYRPTLEAGEEATAVTSSGEAQAPKRSLKARLLDELKEFLMIFAYLWLVFLVFFVHEWVVLAGNNIGFRFYGLAAVNALVLGKIMLIAEKLRFAERFHNRPLIVPIAYKSVAFSVLLVGAYILEEIGVGLYHGKGAAESFPQIGGGGPLGALCVAALLCIALVPFFAFREIARVVGEAEFRTLMIGPPKSALGRTPIPADGAPGDAD